MISASAERLAHRDIDVPGDAGEQETALDLRTRYRLLVPQRSQRAAPDREWKAVPARITEARAHLRQRNRHPPHRAAAEGTVARERGGETVSREHPEQKSSRGA